MIAFAEWYRRLHGREAFPWQVRLAADGRFPGAISLPTGAGKTSVIAIWAWALQAGVRVPARVAYVIDRRLVVDSITSYASELANSISGPLQPDVVRLRGGLTPDDSWIRDPLRPAILVSTVDQVGSRLLFRGYGVSSLAAPIHAGLLGEDTLIIVDEAHLSMPFVATLRAIESYPRALGLPWQVVNMTATPVAGDEPFVLDEDDRRHPALRKRMAASKPARLISPKAGAFGQALVNEARALRESGARVIGVVVNRVADAREAFNALTSEAEAVLLTGRIRPADRDVLLERLIPRVITGSRARGRDPLYVVATQTIEVGADLDFDGLVTESAPISALRQRFGRLNRLGELETSPAAIVHRPRADEEKVDPVYGADLAVAWKWLCEIARRNMVDFGIDAFSRLAGKAPIETPQDFPALTPATVEALSFTSPRVEVDVTPFLHGWRSSVDIQVAWRADLGEPADWAETVASVPPLLDEILTLPFYEVRKWLDPQAGRAAALRWDGDLGEMVTGAELKSGDLIVVPAGYGGCDEFGWCPGNPAPVVDLGDVVFGTRRRIRVSPLLYPDRSEDVRAALDRDPVDLDSLLEIAGIPRELRDSGMVRHYRGGVVFESGIWQVERPQRVSVALDEHLKGVGAWGGRFAAGLRYELRDAVVTACKQHDVGKADPRFQLMLGARRGELLAKSGLGPDEALQLRCLSGLPSGWRHEIESVRRRMQDGSLVRYLIGTHHGYGRPELPASADPAQWSEAGGEAWADTVAELTSAFGVWGLAYLSALVRLADWARSAEEVEIGRLRPIRKANG